jgi:hypothetical protein
MANLTVIYITSNVEDETFEGKIRGKLLEVVGDNPIVSVSQKPIDLGHNICVGEVGSTYRNANIQLVIGAQYATTEYVAVAEADQLYPPGYFDFKPVPGVPLYMNKDLFVLRCWDKSRFWRKVFGDWTVIVNRLYFIERLKGRLGNNMEWGGGKIRPTFPKLCWEVFDPGAPVITIKTPMNVSRVTGIDRSECHQSLPHWGRAIDLSTYLGLHSHLGEKK